MLTKEAMDGLSTKLAELATASAFFKQANPGIWEQLMAAGSGAVNQFSKLDPSLQWALGGAAGGAGLGLLSQIGRKKEERRPLTDALLAALAGAAAGGGGRLFYDQLKNQTVPGGAAAAPQYQNKVNPAFDPSRPADAANPLYVADTNSVHPDAKTDTTLLDPKAYASPMETAVTMDRLLPTATGATVGGVGMAGANVAAGALRSPITRVNNLLRRLFVPDEKQIIQNYRSSNSIPLVGDVSLKYPLHNVGDIQSRVTPTLQRSDYTPAIMRNGTVMAMPTDPTEIANLQSEFARGKAQPVAVTPDSSLILQYPKNTTFNTATNTWSGRPTNVLLDPDTHFDTSKGHLLQTRARSLQDVAAELSNYSNTPPTGGIFGFFRKNTVPAQYDLRPKPVVGVDGTQRSMVSLPTTLDENHHAPQPAVTKGNAPAAPAAAADDAAGALAASAPRNARHVYTPGGAAQATFATPNHTQAGGLAPGALGPGATPAPITPNVSPATPTTKMPNLGVAAPKSTPLRMDMEMRPVYKGMVQQLDAARVAAAKAAPARYKQRAVRGGLLGAALGGAYPNAIPGAINRLNDLFGASQPVPGYDR